MKKRIAAVTMVYNEQFHLPRWVRHYSSQVGGLENLFVLDHGSDDGSTRNLGAVNLISLAREEGQGQYQTWRTRYVSDFTANLLLDYDFVIYSDADELLIADPFRFRHIYEYVSVTAVPKGTAIGYDVIQDIRSEQELGDYYIGEQRSKLQLVAAMCKPLLISSKTDWSRGFHCSSQPPAFGDLFLFHLRYADLQRGLQRLDITRQLARPDMAEVRLDHQRISNETYTEWVQSWGQFPVRDGPIGLSSREISAFINSLEFSRGGDGIYKFDYSFRSNFLYRVPEAFRYTF